MKISIAICFLFLTLSAAVTFAGKPVESPGAIVSFALTDASGNPYYTRPSDGKGDLIDGVDCVYAKLEFGGLNFGLNTCTSKRGDPPPSRFMEVNMASPANGQNPLPDYMAVTSFHIVCPSILSLTAAGQSVDIDLGWAVDIPVPGQKSAINYKVRYGQGGTPLAHVTCLADSGGQCTQWQIVPGGGMDLAVIFTDVSYGVFHVPFHLIVTRK